MIAGLATGLDDIVEFIQKDEVSKLIHPTRFHLFSVCGCVHMVWFMLVMEGVVDCVDCSAGSVREQLLHQWL